ncbi:hypothetical protein NSZ01_05110 [Nocardioides szechwanensis]|nr:hypothetical protein NSZ01_05110 [Nocardioides szechwanensis]
MREAVKQVDRAIDKAQSHAKHKPVELSVGLNAVSHRVTQTRLAALSRPRIATIVPKINEAAAGKVGASLAALSGGRGLGNIGSDLADYIGGLDKAVPKIAAAGLAVATLSSLALASSSNVLALGTSLASTAGAGLALPGILGGLAIGFGASIAVLKDFNEVLPGVSERLSALQDSMSTRFWNQAKEPFQDFIQSIFPQFASGMNDTSTALGTFFGNLANSGTSVFDGQLNSMFVDLQRSIRISGQYTDEFVGILEKLGSVGAGNLPRLAGWFGDISTEFNNWLAKKGDSGLQTFVDEGVTALKDLGGVLNATGGIFAGLARAAEVAGGSTLSIMRDTLEGVERIVDSSKFQTALSNAFRGAHEGMSALTDEAGPALQSLLYSLSDTLTTVLPSAGKTAGTALGAIFDGLDQPKVQQSIIGLFDNIGTAVDNLKGSMPGVGKALASIVDVVGDVGVNLSRALGPALDTISPAIVSLSEDLGPLIDQLGDLLVNAVKGASPVIVDLVSVLGDLAGALAMILQPINELADLFGKLPDPVQSAIGSLVSVGLLVGGAMWMGAAVRAKLMLLSGAILDAGTKAGVAQGGFLRAGLAAESMGNKMTFARAGAAGLALAVLTLGTDAAGSNEKLSALATVGGGALLGFSVGGPIGAAIGGGAGALYALSQNARDTTAALSEAKPAALDYAATLDSMTAAATRVTRGMALVALTENGAVEAGAKLGITSRELVNGMLGQGNAYETLGRKIADIRNPLNQAFAAGETLTQGQLDMLRATGDLNVLLGEQAWDFKNLTAAKRNEIMATQDLSSLQGKIPKAVYTKIEATGIPPTLNGIARVVNKYSLLDGKQIKSVIEATGVDTSVRAVNRVIAKLVAAGKIKANPKIRVETKVAEGDTAAVTEKVKNLNKVEGVGRVKIKDEATKPVNEVQTLLVRYGKMTVSALVKITDHATAGINAVRANLQSLNGDTATVTTLHRNVTTFSGGGSTPDPLGEGASGRVVAGKAGQAAAAAFAENFSRVIDRYMSKTSGMFDKLIDKAKTKEQRKHLKDMFGGALDHLKEMSKRHEKWMRQLDAARTKLKQVQADLASFKDAARAVIVESANPTNMEIGGFDDLVAQMQNAALEAEEFERVIKALIAQGLNSTTLQQILDKGPQAGMATAQAILQGGVKQIDAIQDQINAAANGVANAAGSELFGGLLNEAQTDVDKLIGQLAPLQARLREFATNLVAAFRDQLDKEFGKPGKPGRPDSGKDWLNPQSNTKRAVVGRIAHEDTHSKSKGNGTTLIYNAAPGPQITSEEALFRAGKRARAVFTAA